MFFFKKKKWGLLLFTGLLAIIGTFLLFHLKPKKQKEFFSLEPLVFLPFQVVVESRDLIYWPQAPNLYWKKGWIRDNLSPRFEANLDDPVIQFNHYFIHKDKELCFTLENVLRNQKPLQLEMYLNGMFFQSLSCQKSEKFSVVIPWQKLMRGSNDLDFKCIEQTNSAGIDQEKPVSFFYISDIFFENILYSSKSFLQSHQDPTRLYQPANSYFRLAIDPDKTSQLQYAIRTLKSDQNSILRIYQYDYHGQNSHLKSQLVLSKNLQTGVIDFGDLKEKIILEMDFFSKDPYNFLYWQNLVIGNIQKIEDKNFPTPLKTRPHVFLIVIDAARFDIFSHPQSQEIIPELQAFSQQSTFFYHFYANAPYTAPSVTSILSGYLPEVHGVRMTTVQLPDTIHTLPYYFKKKAYHTSFYVGNPVIFRYNLTREFDSAIPIYPSVKTLFQFRTSFNDISKTLKEIDKLDFQTPQLVYFHLLPPHPPYRPPTEAKRIFKEDLGPDNNLYFTSKNYYLNNYHYADCLVGKILDGLKTRNLFDNALVIVTSDHGEAFAEHQFYNHGSTVYEEMIHVPMLIKLPGQKKRHDLYNYYSHVDLLPTLAQIFRIDFDRYWQGRVICFNEKFSNENYIYSRAVGDEWHGTIFNSTFKYIFIGGRNELYNQAIDRYDKSNISNHNEFDVLLARQKFFQQLYQNFQLKKRLHIADKEFLNENNEMIQQLKKLGYL